MDVLPSSSSICDNVSVFACGMDHSSIDPERALKQFTVWCIQKWVVIHEDVKFRVISAVCSNGAQTEYKFDVTVVRR